MFTQRIASATSTSELPSQSPVQPRAMGEGVGVREAGARVVVRDGVAEAGGVGVTVGVTLNDAVAVGDGAFASITTAPARP